MLQSNQLPRNVWEMSWLEELSGIDCARDINYVEQLCSCFPHLKTLRIALSPLILEKAVPVLMERLQLDILAICVHSSGPKPSVREPQTAIEVPSLTSLEISLYDNVPLAPFLSYSYPNVVTLSVKLEGGPRPVLGPRVWNAVPHLESLECVGVPPGSLEGISKCPCLRTCFLMGTKTLTSGDVMEVMGSGLPLQELALVSLFPLFFLFHSLHCH
jgi:hypothetical protein